MQTCPSCGEENPARFRLCGFCGTPLAAALPAREIRKTVTIVFTDLKGSTDLGERLDSESLREVMTRYFDAMRAELEAHGGTIEKFIGDAIMAVFGLPELHEDDALRAVRAASGMLTALEGLNDELERTWGVRLTMRTGVNTGEVVAGDPTTGQRLVTGDAVNTAARLEQAAPPNEILLGDLTYRLVRRAVEVEAVPPLDLKGKAEPVLAWKLLGVAADRPTESAATGPMVGRADELARLHAALDEAVAGRRLRAVTVLGDAGVGKSRLVREFIGSAEATTVLRGRCLPYGKGNTFWPIVEIVRAAADIDEDDAPDRAVSKIRGLVEDAAVVERISSVAGLSDQVFPISELFWSVRRLLEILSEQGPLVVVVDNIHWAEATLLDLLEHLDGAALPIPCLLLSTARYELLEAHPGWGDGGSGGRIELAPLDDAQSGALIDALLGASGLGDRVRRAVTEAAEGNPLFVEQFVSMLLEDGIGDRADGDGRPPGYDIPVPPSIHALLGARLDRLKDEERAVVEPASVIGQRFAEAALRSLAPEAVQPALMDHLAALDRKQLVHPLSSDDGDPMHRFHHILVRDTAYGSLLKRTRAELHERFVEWADARNAAVDRALEFEEILGYHLEQAHRYLGELGPLDDHGRELGIRASERLASAGRRALARGDMPATANLLHRAALTRPAGDPARAALLVEAGEAMTQAGAIEQADAVLALGREEAAALGDPAIEATARIAIGYLHYMTSTDTTEGQVTALVHEAIPVLEAADDHRGLAKAWRLLSNVHFAGLRYLDATETVGRTVEHAQRAGDRAFELRSLPPLAICAQMGPMPVPQAIAVVRDVLGRLAGDRKSEAQTLLALANLEAMSGDLASAREHYRRSRSTLEELGWHFQAAMTSVVASGPVELTAGDAEAAEAELRRDYETLSAMGEQNYISTVAAFLAEALYRQGRYDEAWALTEESERIADDADVATQSLWRAVRAKLLAGRGDLAAAESMARDAVAILEPAQDPVSQGVACLDLAEVQRLAGHPDDAARSARRALGLFESKGDAASVARARAAGAAIDGGGSRSVAAADGS